MTMAELAARADLSWMRQLRCDPESEKHAPNRKSRQVRSGHFVPVRPTPLTAPRLVTFSPAMAAELGLSEDECRSKEFLRFFSGDIDAVPGFDSWATPYALAIMGRQQYDNCPFKNGNGYGDGRAVSIGEVVAPSGQRWEMQLKGGGQTPFCRGADGRAVLRSSVREFLASEAMHHLGVSTTRAISLIVSDRDTSQRPWYSGQGNDDLPGPDDPRLARAPPEMRQYLLMMLQQRRGEPDVMIQESCAITCRVAPSFTRIGHLDLHARRASGASATPLQKEEHEMMVKHAIFREFPDLMPEAPLPERALAFFDAVAERIAAMVAGWLRVGFCQGNFNCDNCLIAGRTMDYGPFGFIDKYDPLFAKWVGSGDHFAFMSQPGAAYANLTTLASSLEPLLDKAKRDDLKGRLSAAQKTIDNAVEKMWCQKLGLRSESAAGSAQCKALRELMELPGCEVDYTLLFRQLSVLPAAHGASPDATDGSDLLAPLREAFYKPLSSDLETRWAAWIRAWLRLLSIEGALDGAAERMNSVNPKYILREYMLVEAYEAAKKGDYSRVHELYELTTKPYDEQPQFEKKYYKRAPDCALTRSGTAVMT
eukprot:TRINITY_DN13276_c0_g1_i1.p1 TRINITY_DN13276_c0_g1~~TRINITY_DN13276_c0_g1_i1.p1  ORF type:complete len:623 (+),score=129.65 TRINITY_DN13276_c0_g1_i1:88-1869(+)